MTFNSYAVSIKRERFPLEVVWNKLWREFERESTIFVVVEETRSLSCNFTLQSNKIAKIGSLGLVNESRFYSTSNGRNTNIFSWFSFLSFNCYYYFSSPASMRSWLFSRNARYFRSDVETDETRKLPPLTQRWPNFCARQFFSRVSLDALTKLQF